MNVMKNSLDIGLDDVVKKVLLSLAELPLQFSFSQLIPVFKDCVPFPEFKDYL